MAAGSQALKGICALFVKAARVSTAHQKEDWALLSPSISDKLVEFNLREIGMAIRIKASPTRFLKAVRRLAL